MFGPVFLVVVALVLLVSMPVWPWSRGWTWVPAGMIAMIAAIVALTVAIFAVG